MRTSIPMGKMGSMQMAGRIGGKTLLKFDMDSGSVASQDGTERVNMNMAFVRAAGAPAGAKMPGAMNMQMAMTIHMERLP